MQAIKSPYKNTVINQKQPSVDPVVIVALTSELAKHIQQLREEHQNTLKQYAEDFKKVLNKKLQEVDNTISQRLQINKGDKPIPGIDYPLPKDGISPDEDIIAEKVLSKIPKPKDGKDALIDYEKVARLATALIPKPKDGISPEINHQDIVDKVFEEIYKGSKKLSIKHIEDFKDGLEQTIRPIRSLAAGFRGGGDTVVAGNGIVLTNNSNGNKVISTSGSGSTLSATETPNGSRVIFTFSSATAQPSFIVSDNVIMRATTSLGTVNWTWNNATKKATMTIPPVDDIVAII